MQDTVARSVLESVTDGIIFEMCKAILILNEQEQIETKRWVWSVVGGCGL